MTFSHLMKDNVCLVKQNGQRFGNIKAFVQPNKIFTCDASIPIEEGDIFERTLPSGVLEQYLITDTGFYDTVGGIKPHYQSSVQKMTKITPHRHPNQIVYNLIGPNARVNIQSTDASQNYVEIEPKELFGKLYDAIQNGIPDPSISSLLLDKIGELQRTQGTSTFIVKYQEFIALAANHFTVLAPFIPALTQLLK